MDEQESQGGFKVSDRRRFTSDGESTPEEKVSTEEPQRPQAAPQKEETIGTTPEDPTDSKDAPNGEEPPPMDFLTFIMSLANTAILQMGLAPAPEGQPVTKDLAGAKQLIDIIGLLEEKTQGNLTEDEKKILTDTLFQLRMAYVEASK